MKVPNWLILVLAIVNAYNAIAFRNVDPVVVTILSAFVSGTLFMQWAYCKYVLEVRA